MIFLFLVKIRRRRRKKKAEMFPVGLMRVGYREYDVGVLFLIISSQFVISFTTSSTSSPKTTNAAEILSRKTTRYVSTIRKSQQANNSHISGFTTTFFPTSVIENRNSVNASLVKRRRCSRERNEDCPKFVDRYSSFYLKIGGWLMLGIVLAGITALGVTHFLGMRTMHRPRRRELSRILWVEARTKSKLARFV